MTIRFSALLTLLAAVLCTAAVPGRAEAQQPTAPAAVAADTAGVQISARSAMLRSFAIPGWGQSYAGAPGRGAVYFAMEAVSLWMTYKTSRELSASRGRDRLEREFGTLEEGAISGLTRARSQQFEDWVTLAVFTALFSGADAYVTAQLSDFTEHVQVRPSSSSLQFQATLPIGRAR